MLQLYLSGNMISTLPPQLFTLQNLSVLSLRMYFCTRVTRQRLIASVQQVAISLRIYLEKSAVCKISAS